MLHLCRECREQKRQIEEIKHKVQQSKSIIAYSIPKHFCFSDRKRIEMSKSNEKEAT